MVLVRRVEGREISKGLMIDILSRDCTDEV